MFIARNKRFINRCFTTCAVCNKAHVPQNGMENSVADMLNNVHEMDRFTNLPSSSINTDPSDLRSRKEVNHSVIKIGYSVPRSFRRVTYENQYSRLNDFMTPLWRKPYKEQCQIKDYFIKKCMRKVYNTLKHTQFIPSSHPLIQKMEQHGKMMCPVELIRFPATKNFYRNKNFFNIGKGLDGKLGTVGYRPGYRHSDESGIVIKPDLLLNMSPQHKEISKAFEEFIKQCKYSGISTTQNNDHQSPHHHGNWYELMIRSTNAGEVLMKAVFNSKIMTQLYDGIQLLLVEERSDLQCTLEENINPLQEEEEEVWEEYKNYFTDGPGKRLGITSLHMQSMHGARRNLFNPDKLRSHGKSHIHETLQGYTFRISPYSFFQTYTYGAEVLYTAVREVAQITPDTTVLDLCCGTGIIGILLSGQAKEVVGLDISPAAIEDAKINAEINGVNNMSFKCDKAHRVYSDYYEDDKSVVAVVNPDAPGLNKKMIDILRQSKAIKRLVYISCKPFGNVTKNFVGLVTPESEKYPGEPYTAIKAIPVDMFPFTKHCELVVLFER